MAVISELEACLKESEVQMERHYGDVLSLRKEYDSQMEALRRECEEQGRVKVSEELEEITQRF